MACYIIFINLSLHIDLYIKNAYEAMEICMLVILQVLRVNRQSDVRSGTVFPI